MIRFYIAFFIVFFGLISAQQDAYYQQYAKYKMDIDVDVANYTYQNKVILFYFIHYLHRFSYSVK